MKIKSKQLDIAAFFVLILMAVICMVTIVRKNSQATMPIPMPLDFVGE